jgi:hypothetical protein
MKELRYAEMVAWNVIGSDNRSITASREAVDDGLCVP